MKKINLTIWLGVALFGCFVLSFLVSWSLTSQFPIGKETSPRYYYSTYEESKQRIEQDIQTYEKSGQLDVDYEWAIYSSSGEAVDKSARYPNELTPTRFLSKVDPTKRQPSTKPEERLLHYMSNIALPNENEPAFFLAIERERGQLNRLQVGNANWYMFFSVVAFVGLTTLLTRYISKRFRRWEHHLRLLSQGKEQAFQPNGGPKEFYQFERTMQEVEHELWTLRKKEAARYQEKIRLITSLSHDLRTPLTSIQGYVQWLTDQNDKLSNEQRLDSLHVLTRQTEKLGGRIEELFTLAKLSDAHYPIERTELDLVTLLKQVIDTIPSFTYRYEGPERLLFSGDAMLLVRLIENVAKNAWKHGEGNVVWELRENEYDIELVCSNDISHTLSKDEVNQFTEMFHMSDESRSNAGSGIGLSIVQQIVTLHGGTLDVNSHERRFVVNIKLPKS
ncbi:HAMP domain-containing sensor histidine kinase [Bacillus sp. CGMCC 1.16541]|uniref:sensor histidine kinase n=1 Tax=Bacillus sp. CGMCC 1.16541 TaxID=2185143 RepID=UPI000D739F17|nr:HAMP domain-containing sensor histidine kinase [Bacillus sp. CGMCC 1.16541]